MQRAESDTPLQAAIRIVGLSAMARRLGVSYQAVRKWETAGRMPRTEWTGETQYSRGIEQMTGGKVRAEDLLQPWVGQTVAPAHQQEARDAA